MADRELLRELAIANRILAHEGVVDPFGHISVRNPDDPGEYFISRSLGPELVTPDDIQRFSLDGLCGLRYSSADRQEPRTAQGPAERHGRRANNAPVPVGLHRGQHQHRCCGR